MLIKKFKICIKKHGFPNIISRRSLRYVSLCFYFMDCLLWSMYLCIYTSLMQLGEKWNFKQKILARVHQKKITSSSKGYVMWKHFKIWPMKNIFPNQKHIIVWLWLGYKTNEHCPLRHFGELEVSCLTCRMKLIPRTNYLRYISNLSLRL